jgi:hypothetical protein
MRIRSDSMTISLVTVKRDSRWRPPMVLSTKFGEVCALVAAGWFDHTTELLNDSVFRSTRIDRFVHEYEWSLYSCSLASNTLVPLTGERLKRMSDLALTEPS